MATVEDIFCYVGDLLNDREEGAEFKLYTREFLLKAYNEALCQIYALRPDLFTDSVDLTLTTGACQRLPAEYSGLVSIDSNLKEDEHGQVVEDEGPTMTKQALLKRFKKPSCLVSADPKAAVEDYAVASFTNNHADHETFFVDPPVPAGADVTVKATVLVKPVDLTIDQICDAPAVDKTVHGAITDWVMFRALGRDTEDEANLRAAQLHRANFFDFMNGSYRRAAQLRSGYILGQEGTGVETTGWRNEIRDVGR